MRSLVRVFRSLWQDRRGATAVEYGMILALVVLAVMTGIAALGKTTSDLWNGVTANVTQHTPRG
ncbi:Flp family type IVb pilin [Sphingomonas sp. 2R-10]|uniref:Flp family type IVb pilin n=1 Tax=Sphingomonas sp. 2R-10 TaxID=3045148 RepID=UPI000F7786CE|nr:Flp family type IVb pilin [Sphingomonas sp. 2R-10]MDJ0277773.1 Flp family type IVb pilin [Sphingomonas sp. 2R-10]